MRNLTVLLAALALSASVCADTLPDIRIMDKQVFPESITSSSDGTVYSGSMKGIVYRAKPGADKAYPWIEPTEENGILAILGVLVDEDSNTLWACSVPSFIDPARAKGVSALMAFDLDTGGLKGRYDFPPPASACNDITIAVDGTAFASDTTNGRIFMLKQGRDALELYGEDKALVGIDGLAFADNGALYVNNVRSSKMYRVEQGMGKMKGLTEIETSIPLMGPDGLRRIDGSRFLQAENQVSRVSIVTIDGDKADIQVINDKLKSTPGMTLVGNTVYAIESNFNYIMDPAMKGKEVPPFKLIAIPMP